MKHVNIILVIYFFLSLSLQAQQKGTLIFDSIDAPSIANNLIEESVKQPVAIYLPPSYYTETSKKYPVIYFLPGYEDTIAAYLKGYIDNYYLDNSMNSSVTQGLSKEVIFVIANGFNFLEGCFFTNSPVTGNWEDWIVKDVVSYIDTNFRTIPTSGARAILGLSMGGYGALTISMKHPSVFSVGVGECSGIANETGMMKTTLFDNTETINRIISIRADLDKLSKEDAHKKYMDTIRYFRQNHDWVTLFSFAYGSAFAPNTTAKAPYFDYPFSKANDNSLSKNGTIFARYEAGYGNVKNKIETYKDSLVKLKGYGMDYGTSDYFSWIIDGNKFFDAELTSAGIPHKLWVNDGGHGSWHRQRTELVYIPYINSLLDFDTAHLNGQSSIEKITCSNQVGDPVIDKSNKKIKVALKPKSNLKSVAVYFNVSPGATVDIKNGSTVDFSMGSKTMKITSENEKESEEWTVEVQVQSNGINDISGKDLGLKSFPNPAEDYFKVSAEGLEINKVEVVDLSGRNIFSVSDQGKEITIRRNNLKAGTFIIKAYTVNGVLTGKILLK